MFQAVIHIKFYILICTAYEVIQMGGGVKGTLQMDRCYKNITEQSHRPHESLVQMAVVNLEILADRLGLLQKRMSIKNAEKHC
jgi:hypothetical protein